MVRKRETWNTMERRRKKREVSRVRTTSRWKRGTVARSMEGKRIREAKKERAMQ
jgi:hypothetical protein